MRAVDLIPADAQRGSSGRSGRVGPAYGLIAGLAAALALVTVYVLTANTISQRKATLTDVQAQVVRVSSAAASVAKYTAFEQLAQTRAETVRQIASTRFDWHGALSDLARVMPANASLQSLVGSAASGSSVQGASQSAGSTGGLRGAIASSPAFELTGCTSTQDDVARLISRLRLINGVTRVTLADSQKQDGAGATAAAGTAAGTVSATGCGPTAPTFNLVVFFKPLPAGAAGVTSPAPQSVAPSTAAPSATTAPATATAPSQPGGSTTSTGATK